MMRRLSTRDAGFDRELRQLTAWQDSVDREIVAAVDGIVDDVISRGDAAVLEYTALFDGIDAERALTGCMNHWISESPAAGS